TPRRRVGGSADKRITGRALQARRPKMWTESPHCASCGALVDYPFGFELDHIVPLSQGGPDVEDNCQILCAGPFGCHAVKTLEDAVQGGGASLFPEWVRAAAGGLSIVSGPPGSGKASSVERNAAAGDVIVELDAIKAD